MEHVIHCGVCNSSFNPRLFHVTIELEQIVEVYGTRRRSPESL
jgi:hypothetical protein